MPDDKVKEMIASISGDDIEHNSLYSTIQKLRLAMALDLDMDLDPTRLRLMEGIITSAQREKSIDVEKEFNDNNSEIAKQLSEIIINLTDNPFKKDAGGTVPTVEDTAIPYTDPIEGETDVGVVDLSIDDIPGVKDSI